MARIADIKEPVVDFLNAMVVLSFCMNAGLETMFKYQVRSQISRKNEKLANPAD